MLKESMIFIMVRQRAYAGTTSDEGKTLSLVKSETQAC